MTTNQQFYLEDESYLRAILTAFFDKRYANSIRISEPVVTIVGEMLDATADCSEWLSYVPKPLAPVGPRPGVNWAINQIRRIGKELISDPSKKVSFTCKKVVAWQFRRQIDLASGI